MADPKLHVALITREYPPHVYGGAGVHVEYLARELAKKIHVDVHCWSAPLDPNDSKNPQASTQHPASTNLNVIRRTPPADISSAPQIQQAKFKTALEALALNLTEITQLSGANIIHTHTWYAAMAGFLAKKLYGIPFVLTTHSLEPLRAWKAEQLGSGYALSSWMEKTAIESADAIIAVSQGTRADILRAYPAIHPDRIHVIYNGIDLDQYKRTDDATALHTYGIDPTRPYILFLGRITRQKGVTHLVDAIQHLPRDTQVVLCAGAPDTPEIAAEIKEKIAEASKRNAHIIWIEKMVSKPEAIQLYSHCRVFCCPSIYEPFGIINLEAMACEAPVVASATGGILEVVIPANPGDLANPADLTNPGDLPKIGCHPERSEGPAVKNQDEPTAKNQEAPTGFLVPFTPTGPENLPADPAQFAKDLAAKLTLLLNDEALAKKLGAAGRLRAEQHFSWSTIATQTITLYRELIER